MSGFHHGCWECHIYYLNIQIIFKQNYSNILSQSLWEMQSSIHHVQIQATADLRQEIVTIISAEN